MIRILAVAAILSASVLTAKAAVVSPAPTGLFSVTPGYIGSWYSNDPNTDIGSMGVSNVETKLESSAWVNTALTAAGGGDCGSGGVSCNSGNKSGSYTGTGANVFAIHFGSNFLVFAYAVELTNFSISGLSNGVSFIRSFDASALIRSDAPTETPLPAAIWLMIAGVATLFGFAKKPRQQFA